MESSLAQSATNDVTAAEALARLEAWYAAVGRAGRELLTKYRAAGAAVPCNVRSQQNALVSGYLRAARAVYDQLQAKGIAVTQNVVDANGVKKVLAPNKDNPFPRPVAPIAFNVADCQGADQGLGVLPVVPLVYAGGVVLSLLIVAWGASERIQWPGNPPEVINAAAEQYRKCVAETKNAAACAGLLPPKTTNWFTIGVTTVVVLGLVVGGVYLYRRYGKQLSAVES